MASSHLCSRNVYIRYLFVVFAFDIMIPPNIFYGKDGLLEGMELERFATLSLQFESIPVGVFQS
jgi:hypothetical protein